MNEHEKTEILSGGSTFNINQQRAYPQPVYQPQQHNLNQKSYQKTEVLNPPPKLIAVLISRQTGQAYSLKDNNMLGRIDESQATIALTDDAISARHAAIKLENSMEDGLRYYIHDLATTNGTQVNGQPIVRHYLQDGDEIKIGKTILVYKQI